MRRKWVPRFGPSHEKANMADRLTLFPGAIARRADIGPGGVVRYQARPVLSGGAGRNVQWAVRSWRASRMASAVIRYTERLWP